MTTVVSRDSNEKICPLPIFTPKKGVFLFKGNLTKMPSFQVWEGNSHLPMCIHLGIEYQTCIGYSRCNIDAANERD